MNNGDITDRENFYLKTQFFTEFYICTDNKNRETCTAPDIGTSFTNNDYDKTIFTQYQGHSRQLNAIKFRGCSSHSSFVTQIKKAKSSRESSEPNQLLSKKSYGLNSFHTSLFRAGIKSNRQQKIDSSPGHNTSTLCSNNIQPHSYLHSCLLYTSPSPRDRQKSRMPSSA